MIFQPLDVFLRSVNSLSNFLSPDGQIICRRAVKEELNRALGWVLGRPLQPASQGQVMEFLRVASRRGIDPAQLWIANFREELLWAVLPVANPGRTLLLFAPSDYISDFQERAARQLSEKVIEHFPDALIAQVLFEPKDQNVINLYISMGFARLAELIYLQIIPRKGYAPPILPADMKLVTYNEETHGLFSTAIEKSYLESLDCPGLSGMRGINDIIAGHKAAGDFDPHSWFVVLEKNIPIGVALINALPANQTMELVYLGVVPSARYRGVGEFLLRHVLATSARAVYPRLSFAVDAGNRPALRLYYRHGLQRIGSKIALLRNLRK